MSGILSPNCLVVHSFFVGVICIQFIFIFILFSAFSRRVSGNLIFIFYFSLSFFQLSNKHHKINK